MTQPRRILVVEDEPLIAVDIEMTLADLGWEVVGPAGTLEQARKLVDSGTFSLALMDINLRDAQSFGIAEELKRRGIATVFLSGDIGTSKPEALQDTPVLYKPIDYAKLIETLEGELAG